MGHFLAGDVDHWGGGDFSVVGCKVGCEAGNGSSRCCIDGLDGESRRLGLVGVQAAAAQDGEMTGGASGECILACRGEAS